MAYERRIGIYADPSFQMGLALGNAYGNMWATNAKNRQGEHAKDIIEEMRQQQQIEDIANMAAPQTEATPRQLQQAASVTGNIPGKTYDLSRGSVIDPSFSLSSATPDGRSVQDNAVDEVLNLKRMGQYPIAANLSGNEQAINENVQNSSGAQQQNVLGGWDPDFSADEFKRRAKEQGLNQEVIDSYLPDIQKEAAKQARNQLLPSINRDLYGYRNDAGEYIAPTETSYSNALSKIALLKDYDDDTAKMLLQNTITPRDIYATNTEDEKYRRNLTDARTDRETGRAEKREDTAWAIEQKTAAENAKIDATVRRVADAFGVDYRTAAQYVLANGGRAGRSTGGRASSTKSPFESAQYKEAGKILEGLDPDVLGRALTPEEERLRRQAAAVVQAAREAEFGVKPNAPEQVPYDFNDYGSVTKFITDMTNRGAKIEDVLPILRDKMGDGPMYRAVQSEYIVGNNGQPAAAQQKQPGRFDAQANQRGGLMQALGEGKTFKQWLLDE